MKPNIAFLSDKEVNRIHKTALLLLKDVGMRFPHPEAQKILADNGAETGPDAVVKIPEHLIADAIESLPKRNDVRLYGRNPDHDVTFAQHQPSLACMTMAIDVIDPFSRKRRPATTKDLALLTRIADSLEYVRVNGGLVTPQEVPGAFNDWYTWAATIKNTTKHITGGMLGARCVRDAARMGALALGSEDRFRARPFISGWVLTLPPFGIDAESLDALMEMSRWHIPAIVSSGPILGTSSPVTIAGTVAQAHAELLGCIVVHQLVNPGAPVVYTSFARGVDMRSGNISMACPEFGILKVAMAQMGRFLDLPVRMPAMLRDAKVLDAQAGFETGMIGTTTGLIADLMDGMQLDMDMVVDFPDLLFCNECMAGIRRMAREVIVDTDSLAIETMKEVGPGGSFFGSRHTFQNFRKALWMPHFLERGNLESWRKGGELDIFKKCEREILTQLNLPENKLLSPDVEAGIDAIVEAAVGGKSA
jgi:trimethylamine---corrinoid protein Co-methyltransferase